MQSLLTRVGRASNCGCNTCIGVAKAAVRRSATGAEVKVPLRNAFTRLYTTIFATAAIVDATYKDDRRKDLEEQISEAKDAVARLQLQNTAAEVPLSAAESVPHDEGSYGGAMPLEPTETQPSLIASAELKRAPNSRLFDYYAGEHWAVFNGTNTRRTLRALKNTDYRMLEQCLRVSLKREKSPVPGSCLDEWAFNITQLVDYLLLEHDRISALQSEPPARSPLREAIDRLQSTGYPNIKSPNYGCMSTGEFPARLSKRMVRDINAAATDAPGTIERICYNLLTSQQPLTIHTYNTMIVHLNKAGHHKIAQCIIKSHFSHFKQHHSQTEAVVLNHDRKFGNYAAALRNVSIILKNSTMYFSRGGEYVLDSMVRALGGFRNTKNAVIVFCHGLATGLIIGPQGLYQLIARCIWKLDRALVLRLVRAFVDYPEQFEWMLTAEPAAQSILLHQMGYLLDVANLWRNQAIVNPGLDVNGIDRGGFRRFRITIALCSVERQLNQIDRVTRRIENTLAAVGGPQYDGMSRADAMEHVSMKASQVAEDYDFHMEAADPGTWVRRDFKVLESAETERRPRRVWTARDYETARAKLRVAMVMREVTDRRGELADYSLQLDGLDPKGVLPQGWKQELLDAGKVVRDPATAGLG